ncbi:MAG: SMC-Scp complex subunit ScpB [Clostridia bacterium]|nr:SMC-Scp complex subunit ScpB [Clostridia bacterium]
MTPLPCTLEGAKRLQSNELSHIVEAVLFVAGEPVAIEDLAKALEVSQLELSSALDALASEYDYHRRGIRLNRFGHHVQLATRADYAPYVERLLQPVQKQSLSQKAMETLAVVAYRQPVTKAEVEAVRGMKCDYSIQSLVNKGLIEEVGRKEALGRPILYGTTDQFLDHFGISSLSELPQLPEMEPLPASDEPPLIP